MAAAAPLGSPPEVINWMPEMIIKTTVNMPPIPRAIGIISPTSVLTKVPEPVGANLVSTTPGTPMPWRQSVKLSQLAKVGVGEIFNKRKDEIIIVINFFIEDPEFLPKYWFR